MDLRGNFVNFVSGTRMVAFVAGADMFNSNCTGTLVMEEKFESIKAFGAKYIVSNLGFNHSNIAACCRGKIETAYNYIWEYASY